MPYNRFNMGRTPFFNTKEKKMFKQKLFFKLFNVLLLLCFVTPATAQMKRVFKFHNVKLPFNLILKNSVIKKGTYHFEFLRHQGLYYLRILKRSKVLCFISGDQSRYESYGSQKFKDPNIPKNPRLQLKKNPKEKKIYIIFESGKKTRIYPFIKVKFKMEYGN